MKMPIAGNVNLNSVRIEGGSLDLISVQCPFYGWFEQDGIATDLVMTSAPP